MRSAPQTVLFTGGTRSGKSALALRWAEAQASRRVFVATARAVDAETSLRVTRHQAERGPGWHTCEEGVHLLDALRELSRPGVPVVVDCVTMWLSNLLYPVYAVPSAGSSLEGASADGASALSPVAAAVADAPAASAGMQAEAAEVLAQVEALARWLPAAPGPVALVTAEVGMGIVPVSAAGRAFRDLQGEANQLLARACATVLFVSCGLPLPLKNTIPKELL